MDESIELLLTKFLTNDANREELLQLEAWIQNKNNEALFLQYIKVNAAINNTMNDYSNKQQTKEILRNRIRKEKQSRFKLLKYAAVVAIAFGLGYLYHSTNTPEEIPFVEPIIVNNQIETGSDKATLTLENGEKIVLAEGQVYETEHANSNGEAIAYKRPTSKEVAYNYLTIPRGGQFKITLSDGTKIWLNSETQLKYPVAFIKGQTRLVELIYGEAYFEVSPSTEHLGASFKVSHDQQKVQVLGTQFNIKAYQDETIVYTTLVEGKVGINALDESRILTPGEQSIMDGNSISVSKVNIYNETSWKDGIFSFEDKKLKEIMKVLARWYDMDVVFGNSELEELEFLGKLRKNQSIEEILNAVRNSSIINTYEINGKTITIK